MFIPISHSVAMLQYVPATRYKLDLDICQNDRE